MTCFGHYQRAKEFLETGPSRAYAYRAEVKEYLRSLIRLRRPASDHGTGAHVPIRLRSTLDEYESSSS